MHPRTYWVPPAWLTRTLVGRLIVMTAVAVMLTLVGAAPAGAQVSDQVKVGGESVITFSVLAYNLVTGFVLPIVVGIITKISAPPGVKVLATLVLNAVNGVIGSIVVLDGNAILSVNTLAMAGMSLVMHIAIWAGVWRPLNAQSKLAPNSGLG